MGERDVDDIKTTRPARAYAEDTRSRAQAERERDPRYATFSDARDERATRDVRWIAQRASERDRHLEITVQKRGMTTRLREGGMGPRAAASIANASAYEQRDALRGTIADERSALRSTETPLHAESWRSFLERATPRTHAPGEVGSIGAPTAHDLAIKRTPGLQHRLLADGAVGYRFRDDAASVRAGLMIKNPELQKDVASAKREIQRERPTPPRAAPGSGHTG